MQRFVLAACLLFVFMGVGVAREPVRARVDLSEQTMDVDFGDGIVETWTISSGKRGEETPIGKFKGYLWSRDHVSSIYRLPMPRAVFFSGNFAVHSSSARLGRPASHGCIRIAHENADRLFNETRGRGFEIEIVGSIDGFYPARGEVRRSRSVSSARSTERYRIPADDRLWPADDEFRPRSMR